MPRSLPPRHHADLGSSLRLPKPRRWHRWLVALLALSFPIADVAVAQPSVATLGLEGLLLPNAVELGLALPEPGPAPVSEPTCEHPEPSSRWAGRTSDDAWIPGLYPARERYGDDRLALTFDDGPHKSRTPIALAELAERDLHATFFLTGHAIRKSTYPLVQQMVREGHTLANHGWRHDVGMAEQVSTVEELEAYVASEFELTQIRVDLALLASSADDFEAIEREVFAGLSWAKHDRERQLRSMPGLRERHAALLEARGYSETDRPYPLAWVRPPGGNPYLGKRWTTDERDAFARAVNRTGMNMVMWSAGTGDSDPSLSSDERHDPVRVAEATRKAARRGGIFVAHDRISPAALRAMLDAVEQSGVEVVTLAQLCAETQRPSEAIR